MGSTEKQRLWTQISEECWASMKKSVSEVVQSNLGASFKYLFYGLSGWPRSLWLKFPLLVSLKAGFEGRNICENDLQMF